MKKSIFVFAPPTPNLGEYNQIRGLAVSLLKRHSKNNKNSVVLDKNICFQNPNVKSLKFSDYGNYGEFQEKIYVCLDKYFSEQTVIPKYFITVYSHGDNQNAGSNADAVCQAVKRYYAENALGDVITIVLATPFYSYKYVDFAQTSEHFVSEFTRKKIRSECFFHSSLGIIHNMTKLFIRQKYQQKKAQKELQKFENEKPNAVFCLGGRVDGEEIKFDINLAKKIYTKAESLANKGYNVIIVNGPRTPNDVTDFLYEKSLLSKDIYFYNSKKIAQNSDERKSDKWRIYSGLNERVFADQMKKIGNIYPAVLGLKNVIAIHTYDSFAACETSSSEIRTAIFRDFYINKKVREDCHKLADLMISNGYAIDAKDFDGNVFPNDLNMKYLPKINNAFVEKIIKKSAKIIFKNNDI